MYEHPNHGGHRLPSAVYARYESSESILAKILPSRFRIPIEFLELKNDLNTARGVIPSIHDVSSPFLDNLRRVGIYSVCDRLCRPHSNHTVFGRRDTFDVRL